MHIPVLQKEVIQYLAPEPNENFIDCTIGSAGHALAILGENSPKGKILGIDRDPEIIKNLKLKIKNFKKRLILVSDNFANLKEIVKREKFHSVSGILFDLGTSSWHLEESGRGFTFLRNEPLDMRYNSQDSLTPLGASGTCRKRKENKPLTGLTAEKILNFWSESEIEKILREFGEEKFAEEIAKEIVKVRHFKPVKTTFQLIEILKRAIPFRCQHQKLHFAARTFQAIRIAVNDELSNLENALPQSLEILEKGGRLVVISFHSLEDRIVKNFYKDRVSAGLKILNKKPIIPSKAEIINNPRSRSAKLRIAIKT